MPIAENDVQLGQGAEDGPAGTALSAGHRRRASGPRSSTCSSFPKVHVTQQYPEVAAEAAGQLSRRPSAQPRRAGPRQVRRLLHVLDGVPGPLHRHRGGAVALAGSREVSGDVRHRRTALHLLRHVRAGLPVRCHRVDDAVRPDRPEPGRDDVRQGKAAERVRQTVKDGHRPGPHHSGKLGPASELAEDGLTRSSTAQS